MGLNKIEYNKKQVKVNRGIHIAEKENTTDK